MTMLPKHQADHADDLIDRVYDLIDTEPIELRVKIYAAIKAGHQHVYRQPNGNAVVTFDGLDVQYEIVRPRLDA